MRKIPAVDVTESTIAPEMLREAVAQISPWV